MGWGGQEIRILTEAARLPSRAATRRRATRRTARASSTKRRASACRRVALPIGRKRPRGAARADPRAARASASTSSTRTARPTAGSPRSPAAGSTCGAARAGAGAHAPRVGARAERRGHALALPHARRARIVTTGEALREQLDPRQRRSIRQRVDSVPTGIDATALRRAIAQATRAARSALPHDVPLVGIVATLRSWKGHRFLIDALARLRHRDARLVIVGDGPQREALERRSPRSGCATA